MGNLLYKEFKLAISLMFPVLALLFGALMLIPQWIYFLVPLYFCFISAPNIFAAYRSNSDILFTALLPVRKRDAVRARIVSIALLECLHLLFALLFALVNRGVYAHPHNFAFDLNPAFFGLSFIMYGIFNRILFPRFYRTGYAYGFPVFFGILAALSFGTCIELLLIYSRGFQRVMESGGVQQGIVLISGIALFLFLSFRSYRISARRFEEIDIS